MNPPKRSWIAFAITGVVVAGTACGADTVDPASQTTSRPATSRTAAADSVSASPVPPPVPKTTAAKPQGRTTTRPPTTRRPPPAATTTKPQRHCDPAYPDFCIPPPPPDLDCDDIPHDGFRVRAPDPHGFDRDKDGIGCE